MTKDTFRGGRMNRSFKKKTLKGLLLPLKIDTFTDTKQKGISRYLIEYDGWYFEGSTIKAVVNKILKYIFVGGEE